MADAPPAPPEPPDTSSWRARAKRAQERAGTWFDELRARATPVDLAADMGGRFRDANGPILAGYLAYRLFLLVLPLVVVLIAVSGFSSSGVDQAADHLRLGQSIARTMAAAGEDAHRSRLPLLISGLVAFVIAAWGLLGALQFAAAQAWQIPTRRFPGKGTAFVRLAGSLLLFGAVLYVSALVRKLGVFGGLAGSVATLLSAGVAYFLLGWILPRRSDEWIWLVPGAIVGALANVGMQMFATFYVPTKLAGASQTYGALGVTLVLLSYLYLLGLVLSIVSVVNAVVFERYGEAPPGLLRRIASWIPGGASAFGSGYVAPGEEAETVTAPHLDR